MRQQRILPAHAGLACMLLLGALVPAAEQKAATPQSPPQNAAASSTEARTDIRYQGEACPAIADLTACLADYPAGQITIEKVDLGRRTGQEFYLERTRRRTTIRYTTANSLDNAVYTLLDHLGFHWYGPGENWFVKPAALNPIALRGTWRAPSFRNRGFFGTGGLDFGAPPAFDPTNAYKARWYEWKRRNRFNADFPGAGHGGQAFYLSNKALLDAHPEWFSSDSGKENGRLRIEVPEAVAAYKAWVKQNCAGATEPFVNVGVEPEDGRGGNDDPLPPAGFAGIADWNHADKWWWLANEVAKDYPETGRRVVITMYAYGDGATNALVPKFPLRRNVYPVIIPYAFQTAYLPQEMVRTWAAKISGTMGLYDYWNITQWSQGLPQFHLHGMPDKLRFWHANKVDGVYIETTDAAGPMGHGWWLAGQLQFDLSRDFNALYRQYLDDLFGPAAPAMKKMYDRWSLNPQGAGEVSLSLADLRAAEAMVPADSAAWQRINELKAYVHFMKLYYGHDGTQASKDRFFEYLYSIHHLMLVQTAAFMGQWYIAPLDQGNKIPAGTDKRLSAAEIDALFRADLVSDPKRYDVSDFQFDFSRAVYTEPAAPSAWRFGRNPTAYFVPATSGPIAFDAGCEGGTTRFSVFTDDGILLNESVGPERFDSTETLDGHTWQMKRYTLKVEAGKRYTVRFRGGFNRFTMRSPVIVYNSHGGDDFDNYGYPAQYVYVPEHCTEIIFEDGIAARPDGTAVTGAFYAPGETVTDANRGTPIGIKNLYRVAVKPEWQGKVIACAFAHTSWSLKNLPNVLSLQPFEYHEK
jgi:hypothetical protein